MQVPVNIIYCSSYPLGCVVRKDETLVNCGNMLCSIICNCVAYYDKNVVVVHKNTCATAIIYVQQVLLQMVEIYSQQTPHQKLTV